MAINCVTFCGCKCIGVITFDILRSLDVVWYFGIRPESVGSDKGSTG